ncbi:MAG: hydantoinase/oxoprolinase N-terminal domain-containing protein, partial [Longimicrobiales bacterium]
MSIGDPAALVVAVDTGGTFTDIVCAAGDDMLVLKVPSTPTDPSRAVIDGVLRIVRSIAERRGASAAQVVEDGSGGPLEMSAQQLGGDAPIALLIHGSTVATNALLERRGARVGLVTNAGFEDVLE